ncbi:hypothetical protein MF406_12470 [Georgenia sp. TF02-10]|uniref:hypothetical protein n=1 Tax=Georgenia sp. TF02-10 TaxID=2917725 RepID=UPI001FA7760C|nr:hypothetical protein [Georgenia sp. TF02-10]UNX53790.1 hypothetical protein MF406_12470 [Georgenia sp. TF02-10]
MTALRARGASEELLADVLRETESLQLDDDALEQDLGTPEEYADALVPNPGKKRAGPILVTGTIAALAWVVITLVSTALGWDLRGALGPLLLWPAVGLIVLGIVGQFASDSLRGPPGGYR